MGFCFGLWISRQGEKIMNWILLTFGVAILIVLLLMIRELIEYNRFKKRCFQGGWDKKIEEYNRTPKPPCQLANYEGI